MGTLIGQRYAYAVTAYDHSKELSDIAEMFFYKKMRTKKTAPLFAELFFQYSLSLYRTDGTCQISVLLQVFRIRADNGRELTVIAV